MASYFYTSAFSNTTLSTNIHYGMPTAATYNPYNSTRTVAFLNNGGAVASTLNAPFIGDEVDRSGEGIPLEEPIAVSTEDPGITRRQGLALFVGGGECTFGNAFGVALSTSSTATPAQLTDRLILLPNVHALTDPNNPPVNPKEVTAPLVLPIPMDLDYSSPPIIGNDSQGTPILDQEELLYSNTSGQLIFVYPFLLQNAWTFDEGSSSWFVNTNAPIWWGAPTSNTDGEFHILLEFIAGITPSVNADLLFSASDVIDSYGFEDWPRNPSSVLSNDFNDLVFYLDLLDFPFL